MKRPSCASLLLDLAIWAVFTFLPAAVAQTATPEVASNDEPATFQSGVNLVSVPVVVRDSSGRAVPNLRKEDFQLFDRGKPQVISRLTVEKPGAPHAAVAEDSELARAAGESAPAPSASAALAQHFTAYVFDDVHLAFTDLARVRDAAIHHLESALTPADRAAVYTTSGQTTLEFTDDRARLRQTLLQLRARPIAMTPGQSECPNVNYFMADAIENRFDQRALEAATAETLACTETRNQNAAVQLAHSAARRMLAAGDHETRVSLSVLLTVIQRMAILPGQRTILLASPGFFVTDSIRPEESDVLDRAVRANVVLNALDARGLFTIDALGDISQKAVNSAVTNQKVTYEIQNATAAADILAELAYGTGGSFFQNNNDFAAGFQKLAATPGTIYILWFSPSNLKADGAYHSLKIKLANGPRLDLQARRGYFAPKHLLNDEDAAREAIREQVFSREELGSGAVDLQTQFFRVSDTASNLSVIAHVVLKQIAFRKIDGRNRNDLTIVSALFDRNGNFIKAAEKIVQLRLRDETLSKTPRITVKTQFDVPPGAYVVRLVVRDSGGRMMAAENGSVEIPY